MIGFHVSAGPRDVKDFSTDSAQLSPSAICFHIFKNWVPSVRVSVQAYAFMPTGVFLLFSNIFWAETLSRFARLSGLVA